MDQGEDRSAFGTRLSYNDFELNSLQLRQRLRQKLTSLTRMETLERIITIKKNWRRTDYSDIEKRYTNTINFERLETMRPIEIDFNNKREDYMKLYQNQLSKGLFELTHCKKTLTSTFQDIKIIWELYETWRIYIDRQNPKNSNFDTMNNLLDIKTDFETPIIEEELQGH